METNQRNITKTIHFWFNRISEANRYGLLRHCWFSRLFFAPCLPRLAVWRPHFKKQLWSLFLRRKNTLNIKSDVIVNKDQTDSCCSCVRISVFKLQSCTWRSPRLGGPNDTNPNPCKSTILWSHRKVDQHTAQPFSDPKVDGRDISPKKARRCKVGYHGSEDASLSPSSSSFFFFFSFFAFLEGGSEPPSWCSPLGLSESFCFVFSFFSFLVFFAWGSATLLSSSTCTHSGRKCVLASLRISDKAKSVNKISSFFWCVSVRAHPQKGMRSTMHALARPAWPMLTSILRWMCWLQQLLLKEVFKKSQNTTEHQIAKKNKYRMDKINLVICCKETLLCSCALSPNHCKKKLAARAHWKLIHPLAPRRAGTLSWFLPHQWLQPRGCGQEFRFCQSCSCKMKC